MLVTCERTGSDDKSWDTSKDTTMVPGSHSTSVADPRRFLSAHQVRSELSGDSPDQRVPHMVQTEVPHAMQCVLDCTNGSPLLDVICSLLLHKYFLFPVASVRPHPFCPPPPPLAAPASVCAQEYKRGNTEPSKLQCNIQLRAPRHPFDPPYPLPPRQCKVL